MIELIRADYPMIWNGFNLQKGYWYGKDNKEGKLVASSGWEVNGNLSLYYLVDGIWRLKWVGIDDADFRLSNLPLIDVSSKMTFEEWVETKYPESSIDSDDYSDPTLLEDYNFYLYDGLPDFAINYLNQNQQ